MILEVLFHQCSVLFLDFLLNFLLQFSNRFWSGFFCPPYPLKIVPPANSLCGIKRWGVYTIFVPTSLETRPALCGKFPFLFLSWNLSSVQCVPEKTQEKNKTQMFLNNTKQNIINQSHDSKSKLKSVTN